MKSNAAKEDLIIRKILQGELGPDELKEVELLFDEIKSFDFRPLIKRIFDLGDSFMLNLSEADKGFLGRLNRIGRKKKNKKFLKRLLKSKRENSKVILAEGDSWFEFPIFVTDILDWLIKLTDYSVYSLAYGGDWIGNILYSGDYIHELSLYLPDAFLLSGGGNDLVGNKRLALLVKRRHLVDTSLNEKDKKEVEDYVSSGIDPEIADKIVLGKKFLNKDFWSLLNIFRFQYLLILKNIELSSKLSEMKIITQGYDYALPSSNRYNFLRYFNSNGQWLNEPLMIRGIFEKKEQEAIVTAIIHEFNDMLIDIGKDRPNVYHIDCRGFAQKGNWLDELHLKSKYYKVVAKKYIECIESTDKSKKVYVVRQNN